MISSLTLVGVPVNATNVFSLVKTWAWRSVLNCNSARAKIDDAR